MDTSKEAHRINDLVDQCYTASYDDPRVKLYRAKLHEATKNKDPEDILQARAKMNEAIIQASYKNGTIHGTKELDAYYIVQAINRTHLRKNNP